MKDLQITKPTILVLGNEGHGIRTNILNRCDYLLKISRGGRDTTTTTTTGGTGGDSGSTSTGTGTGVGGANIVDSLNVSVSGAILLHYILNNCPR